MAFGDAMDEIEFDSPTDNFIEKRMFGTVALRDIRERAPELKGDLRIDAAGSQTEIEPKGNLTDDEFEAFTEARQESPFVNFNPRNKTNEVQQQEITDSKLPPNPREVHESRSEYEQQQDESRDARNTLNPFTYASNPDSYDFPYIDSGPEFEGMYGESGSANMFETLEETSEDPPDPVSHLWL